MKASARVRANRANARRSTGPKSVEGKSRVAKNALRHGLAAPLDAHPAFAECVGRWTRAIAGRAASDARLEAAGRVAAAQVDLLRVRDARLRLLNDRDARAKEPNTTESIYAFERVCVRNLDPDARTRAVLRALSGLNKRGEPLSLAEGLNALAQDLARLDRYERRALSRRKTALRIFDELASDEAARAKPDEKNI